MGHDSDIINDYKLSPSLCFADEWKLSNKVIKKIPPIQFGQL